MNNICKSCIIAQGCQSVRYIYQDDLWTVNLRLETPPKLLLGWAVLQPKRHVRFLHDLNVEEQHSLGLILARCESAMKSVLGAERMYTCLFTEHPDFHLHIHLIPRKPNLPEEYTGFKVSKICPPKFPLADSNEVKEIHVRLEKALRASEI